MKKTLLFFAALLCTASAWAGAGFFETGAVSPLKLKVDDNAKSYTWNSSGVSAIALGEIKSLSITSYAVQVWKDGGNICSSKMQYRVYKTSETAGDWQDITGTWKGNSGNNGNNQVWGTKTDANKDVTPATPGEYKLEIQFISTGSENSTNDCTSTFTLNNGGKYYTINFTIPTPSVPYVIFSEDMPTTVEAGTEVALSATSENFSGEVSYAYSVKEPDAEGFAAIDGTSYTPTTVGTYTLKVVATAGSESAEKEMKLTVKAAAIDITIRVQIPTGMTGWDYSVAPYLYNWKEEDGIAGNFVAMTSEDDNWYSATVHAASINFIVVNGNNWNGDARQTVDVKGVTASGCYTLGNASGKKSANATICPSTEPSVAFEGMPSTAIAGEAITLTSTYQNFSTEPTITYSVKAPDAADFTTIEGTSYTPTTVGTYTLKVVATAGEESAENTLNVTVTTKYYLAGSGLPGIGSWVVDGYQLVNNTVTFKDVAAETAITFKITDGTWANNWGYDNVDAENSDTGYEADGKNVKLVTKEVTDVTISFDPTTKKITVKGSFGAKITITSYTIVGDEALTGIEWDKTATANDMTEGENDIWTLTKTGVSLTVGEYKYKVVGNHDYNVYQLPASSNQILNISETGVYTVTFTLDVTAGTLNANAVRTDVTPTSIDNAAAVSVYAENGTIYAEGAMRIYTISGIDVTEQNGQLQGIYVVKTSGKITKVVVR